MTNCDPFKIFGIGLNKTGTSTLGRCFRKLGLGPVAPVGDKATRSCTRQLFENRDYQPALHFAKTYRCFEDRPWNVWQMYRKLDTTFPGSRFILTTRCAESWWRSVERWLSFSKPGMLRIYCRHLKVADASEFMSGGRTRNPLLFGAKRTSQENEQFIRLQEFMLREYERYNREVMDYFSGRDDLLVIDFAAGDGWEALCQFLDLPIPTARFPHANRQYYDERDKKRKFRNLVRSSRKIIVKAPAKLMNSAGCRLRRLFQFR